MLPFRIEFKPGIPVSEQVAYAVKKAAISGVLRSGERFPSVRVLSQELRINPNTAHKVVASLVAEGLLEVHPGIGTVVGKATGATPQERGALLDDDLERIAVEAKRLGLGLAEVQQALKQHWTKLS